MALNQPEYLVSPDKKSRIRASDHVVNVIGDRIRSGVYKEGDLLPAERSLAAELQVNRRSVRMAVDQLATDGVLSVRPNCRPAVGLLSSHPLGSAQPDADVQKSPRRISTSNLIALIMWHGGGPLEQAGTSQQRIFWGMNQQLLKLGYHAVFLDLGGDVVSPEAAVAAREAEHLRYILDQRFGGALFYPYAYQHNSELVKEVSRTVPLVLLDRKIVGADTDFVGIENRKSFFEVTEHLAAQGHRLIAHLTRSEPIQSVQDRVQGYLDAVRRADFSRVTPMILTLPPYDDDSTWTVVDAVFRLPKEQRPTAVACMNDYLAVSLSERLKVLGLSVPADVAITGFDNIVPALPNGSGLTTVAQPYEEIGTAAVDLLMRRIKDPRAASRSFQLPAQLIVRESSTLQME